MAQKVEIEYAARGAEQVVSASEKQARAIGEITKSVRNNTTEAGKHAAALRRRRKAQKEDIAASKEAAKVLTDIQTPQQRYLQQVGKLTRLQNAGKISLQQLTEGRKKYQAQFLKESGATERRAKIEKDAIAQRVKLERDASEKIAKANARKNALQREANQLVTASLTPQQQYNQQVARATELEQQGHLTKKQLAQATKGYKAELTRATEAQDRNNKELQESRRIVERNRSPLSRYRQEIARLQTHLDRGRISQRDFRMEVARAKREMDAAKRSARELGASGKFAGLSRGIKSVSAGIFAGAGVLAGLRFWINANSKIIEQSDEIKTRYDTVTTRFAVQSGIPELEEEAATTKILDIAETRRVPVEKVADSATQLVSSGFTVEATLKGGALNEFTKALNASNLVRPDLDPKNLAKASGQFLASQGLEKNAQNLSDLLRRVQKLFKTTDVQVSDLEDLAKVSSGFKGKLSQPEILSYFSLLRETEGGAAEASTGFRNIVSRTSTIAASNDKVKALASLGLEPGQVDLIGENFSQVLKTYADAIKKTQAANAGDGATQRLDGKIIAADQQLDNKQITKAAHAKLLTNARKEFAESDAVVSIALKKIFEERAVPAVLNLIGDRNGVAATDIAKQRIESLKDTSGFDSDVQRQERSRAAVLVNQGIRKHRALVKYSKDLDLLQNELEIFLTSRKAAPTTITASQAALKNQIALGLNRRDSLTRALKVSGFGEEESDEVLERLKAAQRKEGFDARVDQLPGVGAIGSEARKNVTAQQERGFNPDARVKRARQQFEASLGTVSDSLFGGDTFGKEVYRQKQRQEFNRRVVQQRFSLKPGGIENQTSQLLQSLSDSTDDDARLNPSKRRTNAAAIKGSLEELQRFAGVARQRQLQEQQTGNDIQRETLEVLKEIRTQNQDSTVAPSPKRRTPRAAALSRNN